jgi:PD-(D/E)XK nuclease superfamily
MNNVITASRMVTTMQCLRKSYWQYEIGLRREQTSPALLIGTAWAAAQEARWNGKSYEQAVEIGFAAAQLSAYDGAIFTGLLAGYFRFYNRKSETIKHIEPEQEFSFPLEGTEFSIAGKLDGLGVKKNNRRCMVEGKTTGESIAPDAPYWLRLKFNMQLFQYVDAAQRSGIELDEVIYDVTRKPAIRPKDVQEVDDQNMVVVRDSQGQRVKNSRTGEWKKTADKTKGESIAVHTETPDEFSDRLYDDTTARPDFYFARREVAILDGDLEQFKEQRIAIVETIIHRRECQFTFSTPESAWPRNVLESTCTYCPYKSFCLQNLEIDLNNPPEGFSIEAFNPELTKYESSTTPTAQDDTTV